MVSLVWFCGNPKMRSDSMYRHSHTALGLAAITAGTVHSGGVHLIWATVVAATAAGAVITATHIAVGLGIPHPQQLLGGLRRRFTNSDEPAETGPAHF